MDDSAIWTVRRQNNGNSEPLLDFARPGCYSTSNFFSSLSSSLVLEPPSVRTQRNSTEPLLQA